MTVVRCSLLSGVERNCAGDMMNVIVVLYHPFYLLFGSDIRK